MPNLSILIPVRDADPRHLSQSLESLAAADIQDFEVIIGLDGESSGGTCSVIEEFTFNNKSVKAKLLSLPRLGISATLNAMIDTSDSRWIARHDADDFSSPTRFKRQLSAMNQLSDYAFCGTQITRCDGHLRPKPFQRPLPIGFRSQILYASCLNNPIAHPTLMINRSRLGVMRYRDIRGAEDWQLYVDLWRLGCKSFNLKTSELLYRTHAKQVTMKKREWNKVRRLKDESLAVAVEFNISPKVATILNKASSVTRLSEFSIACLKKL